MDLFFSFPCSLQNQDHSNRVANQNKLRSTEVGAAVKSGEDLAAPITFVRFWYESYLSMILPFRSVSHDLPPIDSLP